MPLSRRERWVAAFGRLRLFMGGDGDAVDSHSQTQDRIMQARDALDRQPKRLRRTRGGMHLVAEVDPKRTDAKAFIPAPSSKVGMEAVLAGHLVKYADSHFIRGDRLNGRFALDEAQRCEEDTQRRRALGPMPPL